ncbi:MAG: helix-turn-helix domain-containing protein [Vicinamibacteria bacterium]
MTHRYRGQFLKNLRLQQNLSLKRVSDETRITTWYLAGIEEEQFDRFPGKFYFNSFTKQYASHLGLDPREVATDLEFAYDAWEVRHKPPAVAKDVAITDGSLLGLLQVRPKSEPSEV